MLVRFFRRGRPLTDARPARVRSSTEARVYRGPTLTRLSVRFDAARGGGRAERPRTLFTLQAVRLRAPRVEAASTESAACGRDPILRCSNLIANIQGL